ncbi:MAG: DUF2148 domain-containing protein [Bacteroidales bacterium]|nr:DUF2148 domain-containing protein [Bacteroidales bacterium]MDD3431668.1 DUF2148 domain-containing protein [Bacteroidales bacterium]MDD4362153.1 DUF2148 domain-containing protein [Bacteroidales bacterium]MDD4431046.1 DUF2148 domain-containing protein [Bacteroidales bacterium]
MIENEKNTTIQAALEVARRMMTAARTAPKAKGMDRLELCCVSGEELETLAKKMEEIGLKNQRASFARDAGNIRQSQAVVLLGSRKGEQELNCGYCGFPTCAEKRKNPAIPCVFPVTDLGIALGSACSVAADSRADNRVMYTAGMAALELGWLKDCFYALSIPLSIAGKSPYFDRK